MPSPKASMEIPSSHAGVVKALSVKLGDKVSEGSVLLVLEASGDVAVPATATEDIKQNQPLAQIAPAQAAI